jgi:hypothetical protein
MTIAPGRRSLLRRAAAGLAGGAVLVGSAWAGTGLTGGAGDPTPRGGLVAPSREAAAGAASLAAQAADPRPPDLSGLRPLPAGEFLVGAAVTSLAPDAERWQTEGCSENLSNAPEEITHLAGLAGQGQLPGWPRSPDCIYLGGYGIGPARAATGIDPHAGVSVRSLAISNGADTVVWQMVDMVGFFARYRSELCDRCGILDIREHIAGTVGLSVDDIAIGSTHTHGGADGYGAWGGMPRWYREQVRDQVIASAYDALRAMEPATISVGAVDARSFNRERRDTYHSTPDYGAVWLHARAKGRKAVLATLVNYAAHPTVLGSQSLLHGDWPAAMATELGSALGGVGLVFEGGLGNVSPSRPNGATVDLTGDGAVDDYDEPVQMADDFAALIRAEIERGGHQLASNEIATASETIAHPATNWVLAGAGVAGLLDRDFTPGPGAGGAGRFTWSKQDAAGLGGSRACTTAGPLTIKTTVSAFRVGELSVLTGPGELFSNMTEVVKSEVRRDALSGGQTMVFGQTQDSLGYIIQSFEVDPVGGAATYADANGHPAEYEELFMLDRCFGDHVLATQLGLAARLSG